MVYCRVSHSAYLTWRWYAGYGQGRAGHGIFLLRNDVVKVARVVCHQNEIWDLSITLNPVMVVVVMKEDDQLIGISHMM